jgi:hypothetical protein
LKLVWVLPKNYTPQKIIPQIGELGAEFVLNWGV